MSELPPILMRAVALLLERTQPEAALPWLLAGQCSLALQGIVLPEPPTQLLVITGMPEIAQLAALLGGEEQEQLATRSAPGFAASPRGVYRLAVTSDELPVTSDASGAGFEVDSSLVTRHSSLVAVELVGDLRAVGAFGELSLALELVWPLREELPLGAGRTRVTPLELEMASALLRGKQAEAHAIASHLFTQGARWERLDAVLAFAPALEQPLWELMDQVRPMARRARSRRARRQMGWGGPRR